MNDRNGTGSADDIGWLPDVDDFDFVGVRPEVEKILAAENEGSGSDLTRQQARAAQLMARLLDAASVDAVLALPRGTVKALMNEESFSDQVIRYRRLFVTNRSADEDFARILNPKQRAAARMRTLEMRSQAEVARALDVTPRSIRNWEKHPWYQMYQEQLEREQGKRRQMRAARHADRVFEAQDKALAVLERAVDADDRKAAVDVLRLKS